MRRAERLFRLVNELRSRGVSRAEDLAKHFELSVRTIYRDIAHLQGSGLPIEGEAGVGYLLRPGFDLPAMTFTFDQLDALAMGLSFVEVAGDTSLSEAARDVRAKLQAILPEQGKRSLEAAPLFASRRDGRASPLLKTVRQAIRESEVLKLHYISAGEHETDRRVRPLAIWAFTDGWLFAAWCELRNDFRAFRLDRISSAKRTGAYFTDEQGKCLTDYLSGKLLSPRGG